MKIIQKFNIKKKYKASLTIESAYIFSIIIISVCTFIIFVNKKHSLYNIQNIANLSLERLAHSEEKYDFNVDELSKEREKFSIMLDTVIKTSKGKYKLFLDSSRASINFNSKNANIQMTQKVYNPESFLRKIEIAKDIKDKLLK